MTEVLFEDFCRLRQLDRGNNSFDDDVTVEIVSCNKDGVLVHSVLIRKHEEEHMIGEFPIKKGLISKFGVTVRDGAQIYPVELNGKMVCVNLQYEISFFSHSSQKSFLSEIRRIQKIENNQ